MGAKSAFRIDPLRKNAIRITNNQPRTVTQVNYKEKAEFLNLKMKL